VLHKSTKGEFGIQNVYFSSAVNKVCVTPLGKKAKLTFESLLVSYGYSEKVADELWKWYDSSGKKGLANY
jgi:hypothetical protein